MLLGIDIGTTCVKGLLLRSDGEVLGAVSHEIPVLRPRPDWAEVAPESWWQAIGAVTRSLVARTRVPATDVRAMAIVAMRDAVVLTDEDDAVLRPSILWTDVRTLPQVRALAAEVGSAHLIDVCGTIPVIGLGAPTVRWHQEHEPDLWARVSRVRLVKDWIVWRLTGIDETDESTITRSLLNDARTRSWSLELLEAAGVRREQLAQVVRRPTDFLGTLGGAGARALGLHPGVVVIAGGGDDPAAALGAGAVDIDSICVGTGTASDWRRVAAAYEPDLTGRRDSSPHLVPGREIVAATIDGTGTSLRWFRDILRTFDGAPAGAGPADPDDFDAMTAAAATVEAGAGGLSFFPYIAGQRAPRFLPDSSGVFFGLRAGHTAAHVTRAIMEGVAFQYPATLEILGGTTGARSPVIMIDGEARSPLWNQIKADVLGVPIRVPAVTEAAALGAAMLAGIAVGVFADVAAAVALAVKPAADFIPDPDRRLVYRTLRAAYERIHECLEPAFALGASPVVSSPSHPRRSLNHV